MSQTKSGLIGSTGVYTGDLTAHKKKNGKVANAHTSDSANEWYYQKQAAELESRYAEKAALLEYDLSKQMWDEQNAYNDPSAVAERYRAAGINPRAALSGAASGAGVASSMQTPDVSSPDVGGSYGTSDVSQNVKNTSSVLQTTPQLISTGVQVAEGVSNIVNKSAGTTQTKVETQGMQIENKYKESQILTGLEKQRAEIQKIIEDTKLSESQKGYYLKQLDWLDQQIAESRQNISESTSRIASTEQGIKESQARERKTEKEGQKVEAETAKIKEEHDQLKEQRNVILEGMIANVYLKGAQEEHYLKLAEKVDKDISLIEKDLEYYDINLKSRLAEMTSKELRGWANVLNDYLEIRQNGKNADYNNRISLLKLVLPYLLK